MLHAYRWVCRCTDENKPRAKTFKFSNQKLKDLGLEPTPVEIGLYETVKSLQERGLSLSKYYYLFVLLASKISSYN